MIIRLENFLFSTTRENRYNMQCWYWWKW